MSTDPCMTCQTLSRHVIPGKTVLKLYWQQIFPTGPIWQTSNVGKTRKTSFYVSPRNFTKFLTRQTWRIVCRWSRPLPVPLNCYSCGYDSAAIPHPLGERVWPLQEYVGHFSRLRWIMSVSAAAIWCQFARSRQNWPFVLLREFHFALQNELTKPNSICFGNSLVDFENSTPSSRLQGQLDIVIELDYAKHLLLSILTELRRRG